MATNSLQTLIQMMARLPGLGPRSARRVVLYLLKNRGTALEPLLKLLTETHEQTLVCAICGNYDTQAPCYICQDPGRDRTTICVVQDVADVWALERAGIYKGVYHILGGVLSALDGIGPEDLTINHLLERVASPSVREVIFALSATVDGQATTHYITTKLTNVPHVRASAVAHGIPLGGELDYLDDGTLGAALSARRQIA